MLLLPYCTVTLALQEKKPRKQFLCINKVLSIADKLMCEKRKHFTSFYFCLKFVSTTSAHEILFFQPVLSHNSSILHYKAFSNLQLQVSSHHSKSHWISDSECDTDTWFSFITFPIHSCHCKYSDQMSSALPLSKCQWNIQTNPGTPSIPRLPILALLFLLDFSKYPRNRGSDKTEMQDCKGWPGHPLIYFKLCNGPLNAHGMNFHLPAQELRRNCQPTWTRQPL